MAALKRRGFLGGLTALMASPAANALDQAGVASDGLGIGSSLGAPSATVNWAAVASAKNSYYGGASNWWSGEKMKVAAMKTFAPWLLEERRKLETRDVSRLDVNIACLKSVSAAGKINMQRNLQYKQWFENKNRYLEEREHEEQYDRFGS